VFLRHLDRLAARIEADDDPDAAFLEIEGVGMTLGTEADDGGSFALESVEIGVFVGIDFGSIGGRLLANSTRIEQAKEDSNTSLRQLPQNVFY